MFGCVLLLYRTNILLPQVFPTIRACSASITIPCHRVMRPYYCYLELGPNTCSLALIRVQVQSLVQLSMYVFIDFTIVYLHKMYLSVFINMLHQMSTRFLGLVCV